MARRSTKHDGRSTARFEYEVFIVYTSGQHSTETRIAGTQYLSTAKLIMDVEAPQHTKPLHGQLAIEYQVRIAGTTTVFYRHRVAM